MMEALPKPTNADDVRNIEILQTFTRHEVCQALYSASYKRCSDVTSQHDVLLFVFAILINKNATLPQMLII